MDEAGAMLNHKVKLVTDHIIKCLAMFQGKRPIIIGLQGPQGSGKTTVTERAKGKLEETGIRTAVFSIDDLYKTHEELKALAGANPNNTLLQGRGQPGTHDIALGSHILRKLKESTPGTIISLPVYDKSQHEGEGDRSTSTIDVEAPLDVVLFEGWCMGFYPLPSMELQRRYHDRKHRSENEEWGEEEKGLFFPKASLQSLLQINTLLESHLEWYQQMDGFIQFKPDELHNVFAWRLQAEHAMKAQGKSGMTDEQVHQFVARYMPGYELFGEGVTRKDAPWAGKGLQLTIDAERKVLEVSSF